MRRLIRPLIMMASLVSAGLVSAAEPIHLLDAELSRWEVWMGVPHVTVQGLPAGTYQSDNVHRGEAMGLGQDVKNVFSIIDEDGTAVLKVTGEIYGGLTTLDSFENYHLSVEFRWGDQKWEPRLNQKRDSGILYHCYGDHGAFWQVWKACLEYQVQETDLGDFIPLAGPRARVRGTLQNGKHLKYDPASEDFHDATGYTSAAVEPDAPHGEWNTLEIYVLGDSAVHLANGQVVLVLRDAVDGQGEPLVSGQIQLQSEAAACYYKNIRLTPITAETLPAEIAALLVD